MKLSVAERVSLLGTLPEQGNFVTLKIVRKLRESLALDEDEIVRLQVKQDGERVMWDASADQGKDVEIGEKAADLVVDSLKKLDKENKLTQQLYGLYEKFVVAE